ncbi:MAG: molybdopterin-dependent oxidoreductase [Dehalococcoidia bacterium]|nr:molybdopterin-dependent oxidoreductase [Dehalococcoidia bacterium]
MSESEEKIIPTTCASHCGGACVLKVHVKNGVITAIETDDGEEPQMRACLKGRAYRQRIYAPDRLRFPVKRAGPRGEGPFERITWDEALDTVARELIRIRDNYGPESILYIRGAGDICQLHNTRLFHKLLSLAGGYTSVWGGASFQGGVTAAQATYGTWRTGNSRDDLVNSRLILLWGWNPATTITGTNTSWYLAQARERGARIISIDPRHTRTTAVFADEWIPLYPGADAAALIAMAYCIIEEGLQDKAFLDKYTTGFEQFKAYVTGVEDGVPKTPAWAEAITGMPAAAIRRLAREYATIKPAALMAGIAPGRTAFGEQYHRAASTLAAMTGNIGVHGGDAAGRSWESGSWFPYKMRYGLGQRPEDGINPVTRLVSDGRHQGYVPVGVHQTHLPDFILKGKAGGYPADLKAAFIHNRNHLNQYPNTNKIAEAFKKLDFIVVFEQFLSATARYADIVLPTTTFLERNDIDFGVGTPFYGYVNKAVEPVDECRQPLDIARDLARRMGIENFGDETEDELLRKEVAESDIPDYEAFRKQGVHKLKLSEPFVSFKEQIDQPDKIRFPTPSGKIELYSKQWAAANDPLLPPVAKYIETWESRNDVLARKYPLQLITTHVERRTHTQFETLPWLRELQRQEMLLNSADARSRNVETGDMVRVFNDRGEIIIRARVTERIMPGVVDVPQGAWYRPDSRGRDVGANANTLTRDECSPGGAFPYNTCLVQVEKA